MPAARLAPGRVERFFRRPAACVAVAYLVVLASRAALVAWPPSAFFYNVDERQFTLATLDRFLGVPSTTLHWPASTLQLLALPLLAVQFVAAAAIPGDGSFAARVAAQIAAAFADPRAAVTTIRVIVAIVSAAGPVLAGLICWRVTRSSRSAWAVGAVVACQPMFLQYGAMAAGEAVAISLALASIFLVLDAPDLAARRATRTGFAGFVFGAAIAAKVTVAPVVVSPLVLLLLAREVPVMERLRRAGLFSAAVLFGFLFWNPYVWTDPVRYAKATIGNVAKTGGGVDFARLWFLYAEAMGATVAVAGVVLVVLAVVAIRLKGPREVLLAGLASATAVVLAIVPHAPTAFPRYLLPILPAFVLLASGACAVERSSPARPSIGRVLTAAAILLTIGCLVEAIPAERRLREPNDLIDAVRWARSLPGEITLVIPEDAFDTYEIQASAESGHRLVERIRSIVQDEATLARLVAAQGVPPDASRVFIEAFNEDDRAALRELVARTASPPTTGRDLVIYRVGGAEGWTSRTSLAETDLAGAIAAASSRDRCALLLPTAEPSLGVPAWSGASGWRWYVRP